MYYPTVCVCVTCSAAAGASVRRRRGVQAHHDERPAGAQGFMAGGLRRQAEELQHHADAGRGHLHRHRVHGQSRRAGRLACCQLCRGLLDKIDKTSSHKLYPR